MFSWNYFILKFFDCGLCNAFRQYLIPYPKKQICQLCVDSCYTQLRFIHWYKHGITYIFMNAIFCCCFLQLYVLVAVVKTVSVYIIIWSDTLFLYYTDINISTALNMLHIHGQHKWQYQENTVNLYKHIRNQVKF